MELKGNCQILHIYLDEEHRFKHQALYHAILERCLKEGMAGATVTRGIKGYGSSTRIHSAHWVDAADSLPVMVEVVDQTDKIDAVLRWLPEMLPQNCLVTRTDTQVVHYYAPSGQHGP